MNQSTKKSSSGVVISVLLVMALLIWIFNSSDKEASSMKGRVATAPTITATVSQPPAKPAPNEVTQDEIDAIIKRVQLEAPLPIRVNAFQYKLEYEQNEIRADTEYKGKSLRVEGIVSSVVRNVDGDPVILLMGYTGTPAVAAYMATEEEKEVALLRPGQGVTLRCEGAGRIAGTPAIGPCYVYRGELPNEIQAAETAAAQEHAAAAEAEHRATAGLLASPEPAASEPTQ